MLSSESGIEVEPEELVPVPHSLMNPGSSENFKITNINKLDICNI
jgi:hypothetical protein